jgi:hypothetical protein
MRYVISLLAASAALLGALIAPGAAPAAQALTVMIHPAGERHERGTATFTQAGRNLVVNVRVSGTPDAMQLVHIHAGPCSRPGKKTIYMLNPLRNGYSTTTLENVNLNSFAQQHYTIGLHTVRAHISTHAACGGPIARP